MSTTDRDCGAEGEGLYDGGRSLKDNSLENDLLQLESVVLL